MPTPPIDGVDNFKSLWLVLVQLTIEHHNTPGEPNHDQHRPGKKPEYRYREPQLAAVVEA